MPNKEEKTKVFRDPVHGDIRLNGLQQAVVGHELFQRLRYIAQNGLLYLVYPGMRHSRFEHSVGASHLAGKWFDEIARTDFSKTFLPPKDVALDSGTTLAITATKEAYSAIQDGGSSQERWRNIVVIAALLHDVGHGPLSHTLEELGLIDRESFYDVPEDANIKKHLQDRPKDGNGKFSHEDISIAYCDKIFRELENKDKSKTFFHESNYQNLRLVCALINKEFRKTLIKSREAGTVTIDDTDYRLLLLFANLISGLFDVDRQDYLTRDSMMAGVRYGTVEHKRIRSGIIPILATADGKYSAVLIAKSDRVHMLDHFLVCLYEMYTQLYYHPKNAQFDFELKQLVEKLKITKRIDTKSYNYAWHSNASDAQLFTELNVKGVSNGLLDRILKRQIPSDGRVVHQFYSGSELPESLVTEEWQVVEKHAREIVKDGVEVWLVDAPKGQVFSWSRSSVVAGKLNGLKFLPKIWWKNDAFLKALESITDLTASQAVGQVISK